MPLQDPPPPPAHTQQQKTEQQKKKGPTIHQESKGGNSPNVVAGDHATVSINTAPVLSGTLKPSNDPTPPDSPNLSYPLPASAIRMYLGTGCAYSTRESVVILRVAGENVLSLKRSGSGILIGAKVFSHDQRIVADIVDNEFNINPNNYFKIKHPDPSTLVVFDQQGKEALNVHFMNPSAVRFTGLLYSAQGPIEITPTSLILPGQNIFRFGYMGGPTPTIMVFYEPAHP